MSAHLVVGADGALRVVREFVTHLRLISLSQMRHEDSEAESGERCFAGQVIHR